MDGQNNYNIVKSSYIANTEISGGSTPYNLPRQTGSGSTRGTQTVGYGNVEIDGSNDRITLGDTTNTNTITLGAQSTTTSSQSGVSSSSISSSSSAGGFGLSITDGRGYTMNFGILANGNLGMDITDNTGFTLFELTGSTWYWYDKNFNVNVMQVGLKPDKTYGWAVAAQGDNVSQGFS